MKQKGKLWIDHEGREIPSFAINPVLKIEEKHAQRIESAALLAEKALIKAVELVYAAYSDVRDAKVTDANMKGNKTTFEGMSISSFDNKINIKITKPDTLTFDNTYTQLVKEKFQEYFNSISTSTDTGIFLKDLVNDLLFTSGGKLDNSKVLKLRKYAANFQKQKSISKSAQLFIDAVNLFDKAIKSKKGSTGIYVESYDEEKQKMRRIALKYTDV